MPQTILFDLDGTLLDSIELIQRSKDHAFRALGLTAPSDREWLAGIGTPLLAMFAHYTSDADEATALLRGYREYQLPNHDRLVRAYDGAIEALWALRAQHRAIGIVTSKSVELSERGLRCVGLLDLVDTIVGCDSTVNHKPHPEPVLTALTRLGASASDAVFVGDSVHDMHAGNAAGTTTIAALWGPFTREELAVSAPRCFLERLADLPALLARLDAAETRHQSPT